MDLGNEESGNQDDPQPSHEELSFIFQLDEHRVVHNRKVPFTLAHAAAALPLRRLHLVPSALVIGAFAPDFEYFLHLGPEGGFGHTLVGTFVLTLPLAVLVLWIFHTFVKLPFVKLLPQGFQQRLVDSLYDFRFWGVSRFLLVVASVLAGIATHLFWDSFTHPNTWLYYHWLVLSQPLRLLGPTQYYKVFQHGSTIVGIGIVLAWLRNWYRTSQPGAKTLSETTSPAKRIMIGAVVASVAFGGAIVRAFARTGIPSSYFEEKFIGEVVTTAIALAWWQLVAYGVLLAASRQRGGGVVGDI